jgi:hypothetical protein
MGDHITIIYKNRAFEVYAVEVSPGSWTPEVHEARNGRLFQTLDSPHDFRSVTGCVVHAVRETINMVNRQHEAETTKD